MKKEKQKKKQQQQQQNNNDTNNMEIDTIKTEEVALTNFKNLANFLNKKDLQKDEINKMYHDYLLSKKNKDKIETDRLILTLKNEFSEVQDRVLECLNEHINFLDYILVSQGIYYLKFLIREEKFWHMLICTIFCCGE